MELLRKFKLTQMLNNAYLLNVDKKIILIDAPGDIDKVINYLDENNLVLDEVWLTHYHFDHIVGLNMLKEKYNALKVYSSIEEISGINKNEENLCNLFNEQFNYKHEILDNKKLLDIYKDLSIEYVTGHSLSSSCYIFKNEKIIFSGDVLFRESIGRSDFIHGNEFELKKGIKEKLFTLGDEFKVCPGHGFESTIAHEKENNGHLQ